MNLQAKWMVEVVLDTGQRIQSVDLAEQEARATVKDMRSRIRAIAVTLLDLSTGQAVTWPSSNLMAGDGAEPGERLADALGG